jgi:hypothetical protein
MSKRSGGSKRILIILGHPSKTRTSEKWARQMKRRGLCDILDGIVYWTIFPLVTHRDRELREIEKLNFGQSPRSCDLAHEFENDPDVIPYGPQMATIQSEPHDPQLMKDIEELRKHRR